MPQQTVHALQMKKLEEVQASQTLAWQTSMMKGPEEAQTSMMKGPREVHASQALTMQGQMGALHASAPKGATSQNAHHRQSPGQNAPFTGKA